MVPGSDPSRISKGIRHYLLRSPHRSSTSAPSVPATAREYYRADIHGIGSLVDQADYPVDFLSFFLGMPRGKEI